TAHTLDDQAETVLLKLTRGAGTRGLAGIWPDVDVRRHASGIREDSIQHLALSAQPGETSFVVRRRSYAGTTQDNSGSLAIVRPLLGTRRTELREYLAEIGQEWREDSSNRDLRQTRNRIRHGILPRFEKHVNPHVCETLADAAEIARAEEEY